MEGNSAQHSLQSRVSSSTIHSRVRVCACVCPTIHPQVLVYDLFGQDIISPLLSVKELRDMGITLHL